MKVVIITFTLTFVALGGFGQRKSKFHITIVGRGASQSYKYTWMPKYDRYFKINETKVSKTEGF